jgi:erythrocyte band 7 integral membrane protein
MNTNMSTEGSLSKAPLHPNGESSHLPIVRVQPPRQEDLQTSYARVIKGDIDPEEQHGWYGSMINGLGNVIGTMGAVPCCICCPNPYRPVQQGTVGLVTKFGRFTRAVDPGLVYVNPLSERLLAIDVKVQIVGMYTVLKSARDANKQ